MASDQLITAKQILQATQELQRRHSPNVLSELEKLEPDLAEYVIENLTQLHHQLIQQGLSGRQARRIYRFAESTLLVSLMALRMGYRELLGDTQGGDENPQSPAGEQDDSTPPDAHP